MELYAIVDAGSGALLWGGWTTPEDADNIAVTVAVNHGAINLLSGADLGHYLIEEAA